MICKPESLNLVGPAAEADALDEDEDGFDTESLPADAFSRLLDSLIGAVAVAAAELTKAIDPAPDAGNGGRFNPTMVCVCVVGLWTGAAGTMPEDAGVK